MTEFIDDRRYAETIGMVGEVGTPSKDLKSSTEEELKILEEEFKSLQDQTQDLIN